MRELLDITYMETSIPKSPFDRLKTKVFIPAHGIDNQNYFYYIDFNNGIIKKWIMNCERYKAYLTDSMQAFKTQILQIFEMFESFLYNRTLYHSACSAGDKLFVSPVYGNHFLEIDLKSNRCDFIAQDEYDVFSSTNCVVNQHLYFTKWSMLDSFSRKRSQDDVRLKFIRYDIKNNSFEILHEVNGPDGIHHTAINCDESNLIAVEMPRFSNEIMNFKLPAEERDAQLKNVLAKGICSGKVLNYNLKNNVVYTTELQKGPAHIEFDVRDQNICYISSNNLLFFNCFGTGEFMKLQLDHGIHKLSQFTDPDLFRIPCHKVFQYQNKTNLVTTAFSNILYILDTESMSLKNKIYLSNTTVKRPNFEHGPFQYPMHDFTPYAVSPIENSPYLLLVNLWEIKLFDISSQKTVARFNFNLDNDPINSISHSLFIN